MKEREELNYTPLPGEQWARIVFAVLPEYAQESVHVEISNCGRLRTFSQVSRGNLIHGTVTRTRLTTVQLSFLQTRTSEEDARFHRMREELKTFRHDLKNREKEQEKLYKTGTPITKRSEDKLKQDRETYAEMKEMFRKTTKKEEEARKIRYGGYIHRMVADAFVPRPSDEHSIVVHADHDNQNNHHTNLRWVTHEESVAHNNLNPNIIKDREGRKFNKVNKSYKLNEEKVKLIKKALNRNRPPSEIAKQFGISEGQVRHIKRGGSWSNVKADD
jgi:DNA invertase Pin-like site-specific DNA recombinase